MENWKPWKENYEISNVGNVRRLLTDGSYKSLRCSIMNKGYKYFQQTRQGKRLNHLVHQLVAELFIGPRPEGLVIDHIDRNKLNNNVENLRYLTQAENMRNCDRVYQEIPFTEDRAKLVGKAYREKHKDEISARNKSRVVCEKCGYEICRGWLTGHTKKCDGTYLRSRSGRKLGDTTCINNIRNRQEYNQLLDFILN